MSPQRLLVDAMNVIGSRPTGWWRDRDGAVRQLAERLQRYATHEHVELTLVVDGRPLPDLPEGPHDGIEVLYARRAGRDAADDRIIELIEADEDPYSLIVVTSDRRLRERALELRAEVLGASAFLRAVEGTE